MTPEMHARLQGVDTDAQKQEAAGIALCALVPLWIAEVRRWTPEQRCARAHDASGILAYGGKCDDLRGRHGGSAHFALGLPAPEGEEGCILNAMAMGLALLALQPGGVNYLGQHWEATP